MIDKFIESLPTKFYSGSKGLGLHKQTAGYSSSNPNDPSEAMDLPEQPLPGFNMAAQARLKGNVFETRIDSPYLEGLLKQKK